MNRLRRNLVANVTGNAWSTALSLVLTPAYIALLGVESYGLIGFYMSWVAILGILDTGISATAVRETAWLAARDEESRKIPSLLRSLEVAYWFVMLSIGAVLLLAAWWFGAGWFHASAIAPLTVRTALILMVVSLVIQVPAGLYVGGLMGLQHQVQSSALVALFGTLRGVGAVAVLYFVRRDIIVFFAWQIAASVLQTGVMRLWLWRQISRDDAPAHFSFAMLDSVKHFAGGMTLVTALSLLLTQVDKLILSRLVSLEVFGFYMLAWTVASGLSRVAAPLMQAFWPHFTELVSKGDDAALERQLRVASQFMNALMLPPAVLIAMLSAPILTAWTGNASIGAGASPLLTIMVVGTLLSSCAYPALSVLYSRKRLAPVIAVNAAAVIVLLPVLAIAVLRFGAIAATVCWTVYGLTTYVAYAHFALRAIRPSPVLSSIAQDFVPPALASVAVASVVLHWSVLMHGRIEIAVIVGAGLIAGWAAALIVSRDLFRIAANTLRWTSVAVP